MTVGELHIQSRKRTCRGPVVNVLDLCSKGSSYSCHQFHLINFFILTVFHLTTEYEWVFLNPQSNKIKFWSSLNGLTFKGLGWRSCPVFTHAVPLSAEEYWWVPENCPKAWQNAWEGGRGIWYFERSASHSAFLIIASWFTNQDKPRGVWISCF